MLKLNCFLMTPVYISLLTTPMTRLSSLNQDRNQLQRWSKIWLVIFNPTKTETMVISSKKNKLYHPPLLINDQDSHVVNSHKHVGVTISDNGQWHDRIDYIVIQTYNRLNIKRKSRTFLDIYSLEQQYISLIIPLVECADAILDNQKQNVINTLENIQLNVAKIVAGESD